MPQRSLVKMAILTLVTLGIYQLYWTYKTRQELVANGGDVPPFKLLFLPILLLVIVAALQLIVHAAADAGGAKTAVNVVSAIVGIVAILALIPITLYWYYKYCKAAEVVTHGKLSFELSYVLFVVFSLLGVAIAWPFIVQNELNKVNAPEPIAPAPADPLASPPSQAV